MPDSFGRETASIPYWEREAARYHDHVGKERAAYHAGRLATATRLLERASLPERARVVDFGCGDGVYARELAACGFSVVGLDPAAAMVELARSQDPDGVYEVGGAAELPSVGACNAVVALNVLAYMTDAEIADFWVGLERVLAPGGLLLVSHSNELFDVYALNGGTERFFAAHFTGGEPVAALLARPDLGGTGYNVRANPLTYREELASHGFEEQARAYFNLHPLPPALLGEGDAGRIVDPDAIARVPEWKQQFQCSTLFALARRA